MDQRDVQESFFILVFAYLCPLLFRCMVGAWKVPEPDYSGGNSTFFGELQELIATEHRVLEGQLHGQALVDYYQVIPTVLPALGSKMGFCRGVAAQPGAGGYQLLLFVATM
jgi:hypothetical protein